MGIRKAKCSCGAVIVAIEGEPRFVNACSCLACQRASGSAFSYSAFFDKAAVEVSGRYSSWTTKGDSGHQIEVAFCPVCGVGLFSDLEVVKGMLSIPVGLLRDESFIPPQNFFWAQSKHDWYRLPDGMPVHDTQ